MIGGEDSFASEERLMLEFDCYDCIKFLSI